MTAKIMTRITLLAPLLILPFIWTQSAINCSLPTSRDDNLLTSLLLDVAPLFLGQLSANLNGTDDQFRLLEQDDVNREVASSTTQEIIVRSGFKYENHYVLADDGYITQLVRIVNPLANRSQLKQPPVMLFHGGLTDTTTHVWASSIQHRPEVYPRQPGEQPISSSNRSLGFMLANNGYDVWLVGTRGANHQNQGHLRYRLFSPPGLTSQPEVLDRPPLGDPYFQFADSLRYWNFTMDDIRLYELPRQVDRVLELTGAQNVSAMTFSLSTMIMLPLLGENKAFARKVHNHILMAPILTNRGTNKFVKLLHEITANVDYNLGVFLVNALTLTQPVRDKILRVTLRKDTTYSVYKFFALIIAGSSSRYRTYFESPVMGHVMEETGFRELQHYAQQVRASRLQRFDYGPQQNLYLYGDPQPPALNISHLYVKDWLLISAEHDNLATPESVRQLLRTVEPKPLEHLILPGGSHYDLLAAYQVDQYVTLPILDFLDKLRLPASSRATSSGSFEPRPSSRIRDLQLARYVPAISDPQPFR